MKCLFLSRENNSLPQVSIPNIALGIPDLVVHPAAALHLFPLATLSRERSLFSENYKETYFPFPFLLLVSRQFVCELTSDDRHKVESSVKKENKDNPYIFFNF